MQVTVSPTQVKGTVTAPASKSAMQRACAAALLKGGKTVLQNPGVSNDDEAALDIITQLGANVQRVNDTVVIESNGVAPISNEINCGESGLSARMFTSIAALSKTPITINGKGSLVKRPFDFFTEVLPQLGVDVKSNNGLLPLHISGPLQPKNIEVDGSLSSQFLTGLLFAYSAAGANDVTISVKNLSSKPYIDLTLKVISDFGLSKPVNNNYQSFNFSDQPINQSTAQPLNYSVEGDWSGGAFLLVAGAVAGDIVVKGLNVFSTQADKAVLQALMQSEATISIEESQIHIRKSKLKPFHFNAVDCPDLFPPLVALAAYCEGTSVIEGVHRLTHKESNRALTLQEEFGKMGIEIGFQDDLMLIKGGEGVKGAAVHSRHDHRIAMACAVAALGAEGDVTIEEAEAVNKSYLKFWNDLARLNATIYSLEKSL
ncbi:3-phosphoshikimate 1-carboxyvinyltransferase [Flavisolibacter ginsenosidimutans]|uniref:3-phosphoshikimate 1-carboxyvinyltransferase n=1 Tax=Flavisolibacter ginsenosidimutans TaxID=661481 RepID=A0A5B8UNI4_9BACT|nr:3-phosphoshikimate 1-carboxyvinyltransferase [Flavisolibacter ginsenosidimutans]QEC58231.1 3-phosphoshikimate 1-carboxyvinyltransferase [Flavisolibacter ginsenosidimutans]